MQEWELIGLFKVLPLNLVSHVHNCDIIGSNTIPQPILKQINHISLNVKCAIKDKRNNQTNILEKYDSGRWVRYIIPNILMFDINYLDDISCDNRIKTKLRYYDDKDADKIIDFWTEDINKKLHMKNIDLTNLKMTPPGISTIMSSNRHNKNNPLKEEKCPKSYIHQKYYECLFDFKTPIAYFVKSSLLRFKNMCKSQFNSNYMVEYQSILLELILKIPDFDQRYINNNIFFKRDLIKNESCTIYKQKCLKNYNISFEKKNDKNKKALIDDLITLLKFREVKLQIVLLLEIIYNDNLDSKFIDFEENYSKKFENRALTVARKSRSRKLKAKPNLQTQNNDLIINTFTTSVDWCELLDLYLDKLSIFEILLESDLISEHDKVKENSKTILEEYKMNILNKSQESSLTGFLSYVLLPYFSRLLPYTIKFTTKKLKGPTLKSKRNISKKSKGASQSQLLSNYSVVSNDRNSILERDSDPLPPKTFSESPHLSRSDFSRQSTVAKSFTSKTIHLSKAKSNLSQFLQAETNPSFLTRTQSDLAMNNLQKRQLPISNFNITENKNVENNEKENVEYNSEFNDAKLIRNEFGETQNLQTKVTKHSLHMMHSFRRVGKLRKSNSVLKLERQNTTLGSSNIEVMATPLKRDSNSQNYKKKTFSNIIESPAINFDTKSPKKSKANIDHDGIQVMATPAHIKSNISKKVSNHSVIESPSLNDMNVKTPSANLSYPNGMTNNNNIQTNTINTDKPIFQPPVRKKVRRRLFGP